MANKKDLENLKEGPDGWNDSRFIDLSQTDLHGVDLSDYDFCLASFDGTNLRNANLERTWLVFADLSNTDLNGANLSGSAMYEAHLDNANLEGADLSDANLSGAVLQGANLKGANLHNANLQDAIYDNDTIWPDGFNPKAAGAKYISQKLSFTVEDNFDKDDIDVDTD